MSLETVPILQQAEVIKEQLMPRLEVSLMASTSIQEASYADIPGDPGHTKQPLAEEADFSDLIDINVKGKTPMVTPRMVEAEMPLTLAAAKTTRAGRTGVQNILDKKDDRLVAIAGPCSVHDLEEFLEYTARLKELGDEYSDQLLVVVREYIEKPRSLVDWPGFLYDPQLDGSYEINLGVIASRLLAIRVAEMGMPAATERLNSTDMPVFFDGLFTYGAIGARNVTDMSARKSSSVASFAMGMKNPLDGSIPPAVDAIQVANSPNYFVGSDMNGSHALVATKGNPYAHLILRGGNGEPNYSQEHVAKALAILHDRKRKHPDLALLDSIVIDCSHGNSGKNPDRQIEVAKDIATQLAAGQTAITGVMIESYLRHGKQKIAPRGELRPGVSVTDGCVSLDETRRLFDVLAEGVEARRNAA